MNIIPGNGPATRVIEALAGTTTLLSGLSDAHTTGPLSSILGDDASFVTSDSVVTSNHTADGVTAILAQPLDIMQLDPAHTAGTADLPVSGLDATAVTGLLGLGGSEDGTPLQLAGDGTPLQPILDATNDAVLNLHTEIFTAGDLIGLPETPLAITKLGEAAGLGELGTAPASDGHTNLLADTLNLPDAVLNGNVSDGISHLGADLTQVLDAAFIVKDDLIFSHGEPTNPVPELISDLGHDISSLPILNVSNGDGGLLDGIIGNLTDPSSHHLIDADVGPEQPNGLGLDLLSTPQSGDHHTLELNAVDVAPGGPTLANLGVLTNGHLLDGSGGGADGLIGSALNLGATGTSGTSAAPAPVAALPELGELHGLLGGLTDHGILHGAHII